MEKHSSSLEQNLLLWHETSVSGVECHFLGSEGHFCVYRCPRVSGLRWNIHMGGLTSPVTIELPGGKQLNRVHYLIVQLEGRPGIPWKGTPDEMIIGVADLRGKGFWATFRKLIGVR